MVFCAAGGLMALLAVLSAEVPVSVMQPEASAANDRP